MTLIRFEYKENYHMPATGGLVFMPHRKHAANETTILPKPFTKSLVDGVVEVDLEPTGDNWVWSVTLGNDTQFYAIPDHTGIINHTDLIPIAPSTLDRNIEPFWWAELRQLQTFITGYIDESRTNVDQAINTVDSVHNTLKTAVNDAERHESVAGAYSRQAQASNEQAWEASKGPDGAAQRAKDEADRAEIYRNEANNSRQTAETAANQARVEADRSADEADRSTTEADRAQTIADTWQNLQDAIDQATDHATNAQLEANRSADEANRATTEANRSADEADRATTEADRAQTIADTIDTTEWTNIEPLNGWTVSPQARWRLNHGLLEIIGRFDGSSATTNTICQLPRNAWYTQYFFIETGADTPSRAAFTTDGKINVLGETFNHNRVSINERLEQRAP